MFYNGMTSVLGKHYKRLFLPVTAWILLVARILVIDVQDSLQPILSGTQRNEL